MDFTDLNDGTWLDCYVTVLLKEEINCIYGTLSSFEAMQCLVSVSWDEKVKKWKVVVRG